MRCVKHGSVVYASVAIALNFPVTLTQLVFFPDWATVLLKQYPRMVSSEEKAMSIIFIVVSMSLLPLLWIFLCLGLLRSLAQSYVSLLLCLGCTLGRPQKGLCYQHMPPLWY